MSYDATRPMVWSRWMPCSPVREIHNGGMSRTRSSSERTMSGISSRTENAKIYVCGNANTMAPGVRTALIQVFRMNTGVSTDGNNWLAGLRADGRFLEDIWGG